MRINMQVDSHLMHLRNLAYFFDKKKNCDIHASVYVNHPESCLIEKKELSDIYHITNCAACHMSKQRLRPNFKNITSEVENRAKLLFISSIVKYIALLERDIKPTYEAFWENPIIQECAQNVLGKIAEMVGFDARTVDTVTTE